MTVFVGNTKPRAVTRAEYVLLTWTAWTCFYGIYDTWVSFPVLQADLNSQLQGMASLDIDLASVMRWAVGLYVLVGLVSIWFIVEMGRRKLWARSSFYWSLICEAVFSVGYIVIAILSGTPPSIRDWLAYLPDYGMQIYAVKLLYSGLADVWFEPEKYRQ